MIAEFCEEAWPAQCVVNISRYVGRGPYKAHASLKSRQSGHDPTVPMSCVTALLRSRSFLLAEADVDTEYRDSRYFVHFVLIREQARGRQRISYEELRHYYAGV